MDQDEEIGGMLGPLKGENIAGVGDMREREEWPMRQRSLHPSDQGGILIADLMSESNPLLLKMMFTVARLDLGFPRKIPVMTRDMR
jgi:hypothetical protein